MNFTFDEDQELLRATVRKFLDNRSPESEVRRLMATETGDDPTFWDTMAKQLGLLGLAIPEEYGGSGFGFVELGVVLEEFGRALTCSPFFSTVVLAAGLLGIIDEEAAKKEYLSEIAAGRMRATLALAEAGGSWDIEQVQMHAEPRGLDWSLSGVKDYVPDGLAADLVLVVARAGDELGVFAVDAHDPSLIRDALPTLDMTRKQARLRFQDTPARRIGGEASAALHKTLQQAAVGLAAEQTGGAERVLEMAVEYAKVREQFGRPIGSFQAIKHKCASMLVAVESMKSAAYYGLWAVSSDSDELPIVASVAKSFCSDAYADVTAENIQIHGGIGFTWEHPAHLYFKRARSSKVLLGSPDQHRELLAAHYHLFPEEDR